VTSDLAIVRFDELRSSSGDRLAEAQMRRGIPALFAIALCVSLAGCRRIHMNVKAHMDPSAITPGMTYRFLKFGKTTGGALAEKELQGIIRSRLNERGFREVGDNEADLILGVTGFIGPFEQYVPATTTYIPIPSKQTSTTTGTATGDYSDWVGNDYVHGRSTVRGNSTTTTTGTDYVPYHVGAHTVVQYYRNIALIALRTPRTAGEEPQIVWQGEVDSSGEGPSLMEIAPYLIKELLMEFPRRSGQSVQRVVRMETR
jgi:hypothetical protein